MHIVGHATESEVHASGKFCSISDHLPPPPPSLSPCAQMREKESLPLNSTIRTSQRQFAKRASTASMQWQIQKKQMQSFFLQRQAVFCEFRTTSDAWPPSLGNYMLSDATFVHSVWHFGCNWATKTKQWQHLAALGSCQLHFNNVSWKCLLACRRFYLCFNKQQMFGRFPRKPDVTCSGVLSSAVDFRFCWSVPRSGAVSGWSLLLFCQKATKERTEGKPTRLLHPSQPSCVQLQSIERARYATKHLRDTDSDYVMKKPPRCCLGAVPRYWEVVASCFQNGNFAENTSASLAPRARIFQPILLLFCLFSWSWSCLQNRVSDFFIPS